MRRRHAAEARNVRVELRARANAIAQGVGSPRGKVPSISGVIANKNTHVEETDYMTRYLRLTSERWWATISTRIHRGRGGENLTC